MQFIDIHDAKIHLSKYIDLAFEGEEIIICKTGKPMAKLIRYQENQGPRKLGIWKNKVKIADDFDKAPIFLTDLFYNKKENNKDGNLEDKQ